MKNLEVVISQNRHSEIVKELGKVIKHKPGAMTSDRYVAVNTMDVVKELHGRGFLATSLSGAYSNKVGGASAKHRIELINPDLRIGNDKQDPTVARVVLTNSYDARCAYKMIAGFFRFACENGMILGQIGDVSKINKKHVTGIEDAMEEMRQYLSKLPQMSNLIDAYRDMTIDDELLGTLALEMALTRQEVIWGPNKFNRDEFKFDLESMTEAWRKEDTKRDAWTTFNVLQEKVIRGGYDYMPTPDSIMRQAKPIVNPYTQDKINAEIFTRFNKVLMS